MSPHFTEERPGVCSVEIGETLGWVVAKLVMRVVGDQVKTTCGIFQLCAGLEAGIEGATHTVVQRRRDWSIPGPGGRADKGSEGEEDERTAESSGTARSGEAARVGGIEEVPRPPGERISE